MSELLSPLYSRRGLVPALLAAGFGALLLWLAATPVIDHVPLYDELLHFLAAQGLNTTGQPVIAQGEYTRALLFTKLVAASLASFGDSVVAARFPALTAAMMLVALLAAWLTRRAGLLAGLSAALLLCMIPATVELAVFARFYTVHALLICIIVISLYEAAQPDHRLQYRVALCVLGIVLLPLAWHFQSTTLVAVGAAICGWLALLLSDHWSRVKGFIVRYPLQAIMSASLLVALMGTLFVKLDLLSRMGEVPLWAAWTASRPQYYWLDFAQSMPLLWPLFPLAVVLAFKTHGRITLFCVVTVLAALVVHSIAAAKSVRYIYYVLPFFCVVLACALSCSVDLLRSSLRSKFVVLISALLAALVLSMSQEGQRLAKLVLHKAVPAGVLSYAVEPDWRPVLPILQPEMAHADRVVTSNSMKALYYLGRYDYELNVSIVAETDTRADFGLDERTGGQAIGTDEATRAVIDMPGATLVVLEERKIGNPTGVSHSVLAVIVGDCMEISLPSGSGVRAWRCDQPAT